MFGIDNDDTYQLESTLVWTPESLQGTAGYKHWLGAALLTVEKVVMQGESGAFIVLTGE